MKNKSCIVTFLLPLVLSAPLKAMEKPEEPRHLPTKSKLREVLKTHSKEFQLMIDNYKESSSSQSGALIFQDGDQKWKISAPQIIYYTTGFLNVDFLNVINNENVELVYNTAPEDEKWALAQFGQNNLNHLVFHLNKLDISKEQTSEFPPSPPFSKSARDKIIELEKTLNPRFDMDEQTALPKGWSLVDSSRNRDISNPISLKKKPEGVELLGDNYTFYTSIPALKDFDKTTFVFSANVKSTNPGVFIQYFDGKNAVSSIPYASKKGEWETLKIEFTVDAKARVHRLYSAILGAVKGNVKPSVDLNNVILQQNQIGEQKGH